MAKKAKKSATSGKAVARPAKKVARGASAVKRSARRRVPAKVKRTAAKPKGVSPVPAGMHTVTPSLVLSDCAKALAFYKEAFGAQELMRMTMPDGQRTLHAEMRIGDSIIMVHDAMMGGKGPKAAGGSPASLWLYVEDCDALYNRALAAGATEKYKMDDQFWGDRSGSIEDPAGYMWHIATHKEDLAPQEIAERQKEFMKKMGGAPA